MENNGSINTQLNISNNDIVTMLIEERKAQLDAEIVKLRVERNDLIKPYLNSVVEEFKKFYDSEEFLIFKEQVYNFAKLYNPQLEIEVKVSSAYDEVYKHFDNYYNITHRKFSPSQLYIIAVDEDKEDDVNDFSAGDIYYPEHLEREFKMNISEEDYIHYNTLFNKIETYQRERGNASNMRDSLVAKMTKHAIMNNPDLLAIRDNVLKLE